MNRTKLGEPIHSRPVIEMFWVAEYDNNRALPQYDPFTGRENRFSEVDHKKTIRFWWLPITPQMTEQFPGTRYNPNLTRHCVDLNGSKGFVTRRNGISIGTAGMRHVVKCYVLGVEGGPRREIYPDGTIRNITIPRFSETQDMLHHG